jgi:hypothetical protein
MCDETIVLRIARKNLSGSKLRHKSCGSASWSDLGHLASDLLLALRFSSDLCWISFTACPWLFRFCPVSGHSLLWRIVPDLLCPFDKSEIPKDRFPGAVEVLRRTDMVRELRVDDPLNLHTMELLSEYLCYLQGVW